jgi:dihydrodipicolinate synthase/N-acetylneuraminate lyase
MRFPGIIPAVTTPFDERGEIQTGALRRNVERMVEAGVHGFVATGTMGESASLTVPERELVTRSVVEAAAGHVPVLGASPLRRPASPASTRSSHAMPAPTR